MIFRDNKFLTLILIIGFIGSCWALSYRYRAENHNRAVEMAVDYSEIAGIAGSSGITVTEALERLKQAGATSLAVQEQTIADLVAEGRVQIKSDSSRNITILENISPEILQRIKGSDLPISPSVISGSSTVAIKGEPDFVLARPIGLPYNAVSAAKATGMHLVARLVNYPGVTSETLNKTVQQLKQEGVRKLIFSGEQVLGFRGGIDEVADALKAAGLIYGSVEFAKQKGDLRLSKLMMPNVIKVHSITSAEMGTIDRTTAIERFVKAARERNIRLIYVRMFDFGDPDPLASNADYISAIAGSLKREGMVLKEARPFNDVSYPLPAAIMMALGTAAGVMLLAAAIVRLSPLSSAVGFIVVSIIACGLVAVPVVFGIKAIALLTAFVFPSLAVLYACSSTPSSPDNQPIRIKLWPTLVRFIGAVIFSSVGGLIIAGLLSNTEFMLRINQFAGVKLAHLLPILIIAGTLAAGIGWRTDSWSNQKERAMSTIRHLAGQPILLWQAGLALILLIMLTVVLARSGNDSGVGVSGIELKFRAILDMVLPVRPRTKEFLIGHPALFLGTASALGGRRSLAAVLLVIGAIGEVSLVNTFCHIHTPVVLSIMRVVIGAVIGLIAGIVLLMIFSRQPLRMQSSEEKKTKKVEAGV